MLATVAYAMGAPGGGAQAQGGPGLLANMLPLIIIFVIFYFLLIRPQQRKQKEHQAMLDNLKKGDKVVTSGGIYGEVFALTPDAITLIIAEGVKVKVVKGHIAALASQESAVVE